MAGLDRRRLVLVKGRVAAAGQAPFALGTGYLVGDDLVLTASHVLPTEGVSEIEVRTEDPGQWHAVQLQPAWRDATLDAMLLRLQAPLALPGEVGWVEADFDADAAWHSSGYPDAGKVDDDGRPRWKTVGLSGVLQALGGQGQGRRELELTVNAPPPAALWAGISGAPVFVGDALAGLVVEAPGSFDGARLAAVPASALWLDPAFRLALAPRWLDLPADGAWILVVQCEARKGKAGLAEWVDATLANDKHRMAVAAALGQPLAPKAIRVCIADALASPGRWLQLVRALCAAPVAAFDATGFEPAVMLALGVRAVVRRGVTLTSTADRLNATKLSQLPFNIQETKLVHHGSGYLATDARHPLLAIPNAILRGCHELAAQPDYLDLPAYDAVRCPYPSTDVDGRSAVGRMLVLCAFGPDYEPNWLALSNALLAHDPEGEAVRMLDVASPRLVGQALYEGIRWARTCIVDWSGWRPNVFFELGVRLACADFGPVGLIDRATLAQAGAPEALTQRQALVALFAPQPYRFADDADGLADAADAIELALQAHEARVGGLGPAVAPHALPHDATFRTCRDHFAWAQEHLTLDPPQWLRASIEAPFGKDPQAAGRLPLLFSANPAFNRELDRSVKERWIAAWYYLANRHPVERLQTDPALRSQLRTLADQVLQFGVPSPSEAHLRALREQIFDLIGELDRLDAGAPPMPDGGPGP